MKKFIFAFAVLVVGATAVSCSADSFTDEPAVDSNIYMFENGDLNTDQCKTCDKP